MLRTDVINHIIKKHNLKRYLEVGTQRKNQNFDKIECDFKECIDPDPEAWATYCVTSDEFFDNLAMGLGRNDTQYDVIFLDGLHSAEQLEKDFFGCLKYLAPKGWVLMHDTSPLSEDLTHFPRDKKGTWNGSCYKFAASIFSIDSSKKFTVDVDHGVTCVQPPISATMKKYPTWEEFDKNREELLNLISWTEFLYL